MTQDVNSRLTGDFYTAPFGPRLEPDGDTLNVYYGAADTCIGLAQGRVSELLAWLDGHSVGECVGAAH